MTIRSVVMWLAVACALAGLAASAASLSDSLGPAPSFCVEGGCATVRATGWARPLGIPLPAIGVAFFVGSLALVLAGPWATALRRVLALSGGAAALGLLVVQGAVIGAWCRLCLVADVAAIGLAVTAITGGDWARASRRGAVAAFAIAALAVVVPLGFLGGTPPPPPPTTVAAGGLPDVVAREQVRGVVTVVDFIDFECPFCRALHTRVNQAIARAGVPVRVVRKMVPLSQHPGALPAAIAWCCAERQGKGDAMAEALITAPVESLTTAGCEALAAALGLDLGRYRTDAASEAVRARIEGDLAAARTAGIRSLPTLYVGSHVFVGAAATVDELVAALRA